MKRVLINIFCLIADLVDVFMLLLQTIFVCAFFVIFIGVGVTVFYMFIENVIQLFI